MDIVTMLQQCPEPLPDWLRQPSTGFDRETFFGGRTVHYPGFGNDGHPSRDMRANRFRSSQLYAKMRPPNEKRDDVKRRSGSQSMLSVMRGGLSDRQLHGAHFVSQSVDLLHTLSGACPEWRRRPSQRERGDHEVVARRMAKLCRRAQAHGCT